MARSEARADGLKVALQILGVALLGVAPLLLRGQSCGHDFDFHLLSWMEAARARQAGLWYPHWAQHANYGAGEPRLVFYPPASWILGSLLGDTTSWTIAPTLFVLLVLTGSGFAMYLLAREWLEKETASLVGCLYAANPYTLFVIYERSAFGELLATIWIPMIALFALRRSSSLVPLALSLAAVWLTNAPAAVMACYMVAILSLGMLLTEGKAWPALRAAGGTALGLGLAAFYVVPAAYEQRWVEISRAILPGLRIQDSFLFEKTGNSFHDQVLRFASWILVIEIAVAGIAACLAAKRRSASGVRIAFTSLLPLLLFLQFPISASIWQHAPELKFLQFPWRWLLILSTATCILAGLAIDSLRSTKCWKTPRLPAWLSLVAWSFVFVSTVFAATHFFYQPCDDEDAVAGQVAAFAMDPATGGVEGTDEYTPSGVDNSEIKHGLPFVRVLRNAGDGVPDSSQGENPAWHPETQEAVPATVRIKQRSSEHWIINVESQASGYAVLRLMDYPAWRVTTGGTVVYKRPRRDDGLMTVPVSAGNNEIEVRWSITKDVIAGRAISAISIVILASISVRRMRLRERRREDPQV